jgi:hypothetical protein
MNRRDAHHTALFQADRASAWIAKGGSSTIHSGVTMR